MRYKPSELREYLDKIGARPKKRLSQNFLIDGNIIRKIVACAEIQPKEPVIEIGPGPGALTEMILETGCHLTVIEKDTVLAKGLESFPIAKIINADVLDVDFEELVKEKCKVLTNLPYHIATPIIAKLVVQNKLFSRIVVMVQEEMAQRMIASPGGKDFSSLTLFLQTYSNTRYAFKVPRKCFYPAPKVDSAVVIIEPKEPPKCDLVLLTEMSREAFKHRRKMLRASLKEFFPSEVIEQALVQSGLPATARPEVLGINDWVKFLSFCQTK